MERTALIATGLLAAACTLIVWRCLQAGGLDDELECLLSYLLSHAVQAILEQAGCVGAFGHFLVTLDDEVLQLSKEKQRITFVGFAPAGIGARMADRASGIDLDEQRVVVTVVENLNDTEHIARGLALGPKAIACAAPEGHKTCLDGLVVGFLVHEAKHEDLAGHSILDNGRNEALQLFEIDFHSFILGFWILER